MTLLCLLSLLVAMETLTVTKTLISALVSILQYENQISFAICFVAGHDFHVALEDTLHHGCKISRC